MCLLVAYANRDVAVAFQDPIAAALRARRVTRERRRAVDLHVRDFELVDVRAVVVLGVRDRGLEYLVDHPRGLLAAEGENLERLRDGQAADLVSDEPAFLRRDAREAEFGCDFHRLFLALKRPAAASDRRPVVARPARPAARRRQPPRQPPLPSPCDRPSGP